MKILGLCFLLFVCLAPLSQAQLSQAEESTKPARDAAIVSAPSTADHIVLNLDSEYLPPGPTTYCAFMRTYRVRRDHRGSDVTRPAGYTTCVPTRRFEMKSAVQVQSEPAPRE